MDYSQNETEKRIQLIDYLSIDDIGEALENCTYDSRYILDLQKQEIIMVSEHLDDREEIQEIFDQVDEDETGRYILFPIRTDSRDGYSDIGQFINTIEEPSIHALAGETISGAKAFQRFRDFIREYPDLEREWYSWKDERSRLRAAEWLEEEGLILVKKD
jgi:hypothetical protein